MRPVSPLLGQVYTWIWELSIGGRFALEVSERLSQEEVGRLRSEGYLVTEFNNSVVIKW